MPDKYADALNKQKGAAIKLLKDKEKTLDLLKKVLSKLDDIPIVGSVLGDIPLLCMIVGDYITGKYKEIPFASIVFIVAALIYFLSPIDLIPDIIPVGGYIDDAAVIAIATAAVHSDLQDYRDWKGL